MSRRPVVYSDFSKGWDTDQDPFNADPKTLHLPKNVIPTRRGTGLKKREGTSEFLDTALPSTDPIKKCITFQNPSGNQEFIIQQGQDIHRVNKDGTRTLIKQINNSRRLGHTQFNGRLIMGHRFIEPFKYFYLQPPAPPTVTKVSGGNLSPRTLFIVVTVTSSNGESLASAATQVELANGELARVSAPFEQDGADTWSVYASNVRGDYKLQRQSIPFDEQWTESTGGIDTNTDNPPTESGAWAVANLGSDDEEPPKADVWHTNNSRVFALGTVEDPMTLHYCALDNEDSWGQQGTADGNGIWELSGLVPEEDVSRAMENINDRLICFFSRWMIILDVPENATSFQRTQVLHGKGAIARDAVITIANDVFWLSEYGVQAGSQEFAESEVLFDDENPSGRINTELSDVVRQVLDQGTEEFVDVTYYHPENLIVWLIPEWGDSDSISRTRFFVQDLDDGGWYYLIGPTVHSMAVDRDGRWLLGEKDQMLEFFDGSYDDRGDDINCIISSVWLYLDHPDKIKKPKQMLVAAQSGKPTSYKVRYGYDFNAEQDVFTELERTIDAPGVTNWDEDQWDTKLVETARVMDQFPIRGRGRAIQVAFEETSSTSFQLAWFGFEYSLSGSRKVV